MEVSEIFCILGPRLGLDSIGLLKCMAILVNDKALKRGNSNVTRVD